MTSSRQQQASQLSQLIMGSGGLRGSFIIMANLQKNVEPVVAAPVEAVKIIAAPV
jgi:hypothetical protein